MAKRTDSATVYPNELSSRQKSWSKSSSGSPTHDTNEKQPLSRRHTTQSFKSIQVRKVLQHDNSTWLECSIGGSSTSQGREAAFTCKMMSKSGTDSDELTIFNIERCCRRIIEDLSAHRDESDHHICRCNFEYIRTREQGKPGICDNGSRYFAKLVWKDMERHDQLCRCGCFDFASSGQPKIIPIWTYRPGYGCKSYWFRRIDHPRFFWLQYGVSSGPQTSGPDCSFTCKMIPEGEETPSSLLKIQRCCEQIVTELKDHRADGYYSGRWEPCPPCACDFEFIREGLRGEAGVCCYTWSKAASAKNVWWAMNRHDKLCSCGCFNFASRQSSVAGAASYADWKRHRKSQPYWSREVTFPSGKKWLQCGINSNSNPEAEPDCIITCKKAFTTANGQKRARKSCKRAAANLASHLKPTRACACDFESLANGQECASESKRWWKGRATRSIQSCKNKHDKCCACDCFEFL